MWTKYKMTSYCTIATAVHFPGGGRNWQTDGRTDHPPLRTYCYLVCKRICALLLFSRYNIHPPYPRINTQARARAHSHAHTNARTTFRITWHILSFIGIYHNKATYPTRDSEMNRVSKTGLIQNLIRSGYNPTRHTDRTSSTAGCRERQNPGSNISGSPLRVLHTQNATSSLPDTIEAAGDGIPHDLISKSERWLG